VGRVEVIKEGDTLRIGLKPVSGPVPRHKVTVTMPQLRGLDVSGASHGTISGFGSTENLVLVVSGASKVTGDVTAGDTDFRVAGASTLQLEGSGNDMIRKP
jgi:hypothetical protein